jgi:hypothetical protein
MNLSDTIMAACQVRGRLPDFLGVEAQKSGTTSLHRLLAGHPQIFLPAENELKYFSKRYGEGVEWYAARYASAGRQQFCGEITPYYLFHPEAPQRIYALLPRIRIIVLLRDPVERALSQFFHSRRLGLECLELGAALTAEPERLSGAGVVLARPDGVPEGVDLCANAGCGEARSVEPGIREDLRRELAFTCEAMAERHGIHWP